jgi:DNA polymerase-3 subunit delta'
MNDDSLPWHRPQWQRLTETRGGGRLPHAILLAGAAGLGKTRFARRLAAALACPSPSETGDACGACDACRQTAAGSHPDLLWVSPEEPGKMIKIDAVRNLTARSVLAVQQGGHRVIVIDPADAMNRAAANALLKTLEEPNSQTVLVLVSSQPDRLPATIRSRCQVVAFPVPAQREARAWLAERLGDNGVDHLLAIGGGAPLRALQAGEQGWIRHDAGLVAELETLKRRKGNPLQVVEDWKNRPLTLLLDGFKRCVADMVRLGKVAEFEGIYHPQGRQDLQSLGQGIDLKRLYALNDELMRLDRDANNNLNPQMMLEYLMNRWLQITRPGGR